MRRENDLRSQLVAFLVPILHLELHGLTVDIGPRLLQRMQQNSKLFEGTRQFPDNLWFSGFLIHGLETPQFCAIPMPLKFGVRQETDDRADPQAIMTADSPNEKARLTTGIWDFKDILSGDETEEAFLVLPDDGQVLI